MRIRYVTRDNTDVGEVWGWTHKPWLDKCGGCWRPGILCVGEVRLTAGRSRELCGRVPKKGECITRY